MSTAALDRSVLVLNRFFQAVQITSARRAFSLFFKGQVKAVDESYATYDFGTWICLPPSDEMVQTPRYQVRVPRVVQLIHYDSVPKFRIRFSRRNVFLRDKHVCQYCGNRFEDRELTLDHVTPVSRGGGNSWDNLVTCCFRCNNRKGDRIPSEAGMPLQNTPRRPYWIPFTRFSRHRNANPFWKAFIDIAYYGIPLEEE